MAKLRAAVLAAGRGARVGGDRPKTLLPVRDHQPLLHYILAGLRDAGVPDLLVVTGYRPDTVQEFVEQHWEGQATFVFNARYASWGNFHTVRMALDQSPGFDVLVVNSDIVVPASVYRRVIASDGDMVLAVQQRRRLDREDMRVTLQDHRVTAIGKELPMPRSHGEYAGVSLLRPEAARIYQHIATDVEWLAETMIYYEDVYARMLASVDTRAVILQADEYAEVDAPEDFERAASLIERHFEGIARVS